MTTVSVSNTSGGMSRVSHKVPRWRFKTKEGVAVQVGPAWAFDPKTVVAEKLSLAVAEFRAATRLAPEDASIHMSLANALALQERYDEAIKESQAVARIDPKLRQLDTGIANYLYLKGELDLAIKVIRQEIEKDPNNVIAYLFLGIIYHEQNKKDLAFAAYREAFLRSEGQTKKDEMYKENIYLIMETGTPEEVVTLLRDAIKAQPERLDLRKSLSEMLERQRKFDESIAAYRDAIRVKPGIRDLRIDLARLLLAHDHRDEATAEFHEAIRLRPNDPETYNKIAWFLATLPKANERDGKSAVEFATKACELTEWKNPVYLDTLSAAFAELGEFDSAAKWQSTAIELLSDEKEREDYRTRLRLYQQKKPYRVPVPER